MELAKTLTAVVAAALSLAAIIVSIFSFRKTRRINLYQDIDRLYLEVLKLGIENPKFVDPEYTGNYKEKFSDDSLRKYNTYAFIVWNVCETIADREDDDALFQTWEPVMKAENQLHGAWFDNEENQGKFKKQFRDFMSKKRLEWKN